MKPSEQIKRYERYVKTLRKDIRARDRTIHDLLTHINMNSERNSLTELMEKAITSIKAYKLQDRKNAKKARKKYPKVKKTKKHESI